MVRNDIDEAHIFRMSDDTGMFQHTSYNVPDLSKGYTTDDNARALIMAVMLYKKRKQPKYMALLYRYLSFVLHAQNETGHFRNFMTYGRQFTEKQGSEECFGRCLWALAYTLSSPEMPQGIKGACLAAFRRALPVVASLKALRGQAYVLIALSLLEKDETAQDELLLTLADSIAAKYVRYADNQSWRWFEDNLTYDNALLPWAMYEAARKTKQERFLCIAGDSLEFLDRNAFRDGYFRPVGCRGWWTRGGQSALYDQQPVEASMSTLAHLVAYQITGNKKMMTLAQKSFAWYAGENSRGQSMIDTETGGCYDGITEDGINLNQGAESIVGYCIAALSLERYDYLPNKNEGFMTLHGRIG